MGCALGPVRMSMSGVCVNQWNALALKQNAGPTNRKWGKKMEASQSDVHAGHYEVGNVLGRLNADKPYIAKRVTDLPEYARIVRWVLNAIDGYQDRSGDSLDTICRHIRQGRIEVRTIGNRITVVVPT